MGDDHGMREDPTLARGLIVRCFDAPEMAYLQQQARFQNALLVMNTLDDFQAAAELGEELLFDRDEVQWRIQWGHPTTSSNVHAQFPAETPTPFC
jgi:hypothetical protein